MLAIGLMKIVLEKGWQDDEFIRSTTVAPFLVKEDGEYLRLSDLGRAEAGAEDDVPVATDGKGTFDAHTAIANAVVEGHLRLPGPEGHLRLDADARPPERVRS